MTTAKLSNYLSLVSPPWCSRLARLVVNLKVGGSIHPGAICSFSTDCNFFHIFRTLFMNLFRVAITFEIKNWYIKIFPTSFTL